MLDGRTCKNQLMVDYSSKGSSYALFARGYKEGKLTGINFNGSQTEVVCSYHCMTLHDGHVGLQTMKYRSMVWKIPANFFMLKEKWLRCDVCQRHHDVKRSDNLVV